MAKRGGHQNTVLHAQGLYGALEDPHKLFKDLFLKGVLENGKAFDLLEAFRQYELTQRLNEAMESRYNDKDFNAFVEKEIGEAQASRISKVEKSRLLVAYVQSLTDVESELKAWVHFMHPVFPFAVLHQQFGLLGDQHQNDFLPNFLMANFPMLLRENHLPHSLEDWEIWLEYLTKAFHVSTSTSEKNAVLETAIAAAYAPKESAIDKLMTQKIWRWAKEQDFQMQTGQGPILLSFLAVAADEYSEGARLAEKAGWKSMQVLFHHLSGETKKAYQLVTELYTDPNLPMAERGIVDLLYPFICLKIQKFDEAQAWVDHHRQKTHLPGQVPTSIIEMIQQWIDKVPADKR